MPAGDVIRSAASLGSSALDFLEDAPFKLRYGVPANEKYQLAVSGKIPGGKVPQNEGEVANEERRAAGYLFGKQWPSIAVPGTHFANALRFWEDPSLHETALTAARMGAAEAEKAERSRSMSNPAAMQADALRTPYRIR